MDSRKPAGKSQPKPAGSKPRPAGKSTAKKAPPPPSFMNWLGRQVGHVKKAVRTDVVKPAAGGSSRSASRSSGTASKRPSAKGNTSPPPHAIEKVIYREDTVEEAELPDRPGVILRRTIIDEVVVETDAKPHSDQ